jgi:hypothetical protein
VHPSVWRTVLSSAKAPSSTAPMSGHPVTQALEAWRAAERRLSALDEELATVTDRELTAARAEVEQCKHKYQQTFEAVTRERDTPAQ